MNSWEVLRVLVDRSEIFDSSELAEALAVLLGTCARYNWYEMVSEQPVSNERVRAVAENIVASAPTDVEHANRAGLHRVFRSSRVALPATGQVFESLYDWEDWDPRDPSDMDLSEKQLLKLLPVTRIQRKAGRARPREYNPYNNIGIEWSVLYFPETRVAIATYNDGIGGEWDETIEGMATFEAAVEHARGEARGVQFETDNR